jgi:hypothetical protein
MAASCDSQRTQNQQTQKSNAFHSFHLFALSMTIDISDGQHRQAQLYSPAAEYPEISGQDIDFSYAQLQNHNGFCSGYDLAGL